MKSYLACRLPPASQPDKLKTTFWSCLVHVNGMEHPARYEVEFSPLERVVRSRLVAKAKEQFGPRAKLHDWEMHVHVVAVDDCIREDSPEAMPIKAAIDRMVGISERRHAKMSPDLRALTHPSELLTTEESSKLQALKMRLRPKSQEEARASVRRRRAANLKRLAL